MTMDVLSYDVPCTFFARMNYAQRNSLDIYKSYNAFISAFVMQENDVVTYDHVSVHTCKGQTDRNFPVEISEVVRPEDSLSIVETPSIENINTFLKQQPKQISTVSIFFLDACHLDEIRRGQNDSFLFVLLSRSLSDIREDKSNNLIFSTKDRVRTDVCNLLEKVILKPMKEMCEFLYKVRNSIAASQADSGNSTCRNIKYTTRLNATKEHKKYPDELKQNESLCDKDQEDRNVGKKRTRYQNSTTCHHLMNTRNRKEEEYSITNKQLVKCLDSTEQNYMKKAAKKRTLDCLESAKQNYIKKKYRNDGHLQQFALTDSSLLERVDKATVERLLKSMLALYGMSNILESERPHIPENDIKELSDELCRKLFKINGSVKGIGYHFGTLQVFLSEQDVDKEAELRKQIGKVLSVYDIIDFETVQVSEDVHYLMHVGAKIEPVLGYGTLGCFVKMDGATNCILLSEHVARHGKEIYFEEKRKVCRILQETLKHEDGELDIAAAEIFPKEVICKSKFQDSTGKELKGKLHEYCGKDRLFTEEQKVYIWGASSKPGKGVITIPKYVTGNDKCSQSLIIVKDGDTKFAEEGDSGAVVCTDDPDGNFVYVLGMLIGEIHIRDMTKKSENDRSYCFLPLSDGLKQLARKTGKTFELM